MYLSIVGYVSSVGYVPCTVLHPVRKVSLVTPLGSLNLCWTLHNVIKKFAILHELPYEDLTRAVVTERRSPGRSSYTVDSEQTVS